MLVLAAGLCAPAWAQQPVQIVIGFPAGGASDLIARIMQPEFGRALGAPVVVRNVTGAAGTIGTAEVARSRGGDGLPMLLVSPIGPISLQPHMRQLPYAPLRDLLPVCQVSDTPLFLLLKPDQPIRDVPGLVAAARARPGVLAYGSGGVGTMPHIAGLSLVRALGIDMIHVPYRGSAESAAAVVSGTVVFTIEQAPLISQFGLRPVVVFAAQRTPDVPAAPTAREAIGIPLDFSIWNGLFAPAGTPPAVMQRLERACAETMAAPAVVAGMARLNTPIRLRPGADFAAHLAEEARVMGRLIAESGVRAD
jgi:tripartite-type tricarboxylate transporter receptor subunit TctC